MPGPPECQPECNARQNAPMSTEAPSDPRRPAVWIAGCVQGHRRLEVVAEDESAGVDDTFKSAFPALADAPAPAPEDEPAVFDATAAGAVLTEVD